MGSLAFERLLKALLWMSVFAPCEAFVSSLNQLAFTQVDSRAPMSAPKKRMPSTALRMGLDLVTFMRTEYVSAALCTNQIPRAADVCLQLGTEDGRVVTFVPKTISEIITSSSEPDGKLTVSARRQLKQNKDRREGSATIKYCDQPSDDLREVKDESVDIVVSLQAAATMIENGLDWKKSVREAARVLKPGGRLLFVEQTDLDGESYVEYASTLSSFSDAAAPPVSIEGESGGDEEQRFPIFEEGGFDDVDLVLVPHIAGIAVKSMDAGMTPEERAQRETEAEKDRLAGLSISAFERGIKKRKRKKKKAAGADDE